MTLALSTMTWAAVAVLSPPELRARIVAALRPYAPNDRRLVPVALTTTEAQRVDLALRRLAG